MIVLVNILLSVAYVTYTIGLAFLLAENIHSSIVGVICKRVYRVNTYSFMNRTPYGRYMNKLIIPPHEIHKNIVKKNRNVYNYYHHEKWNEHYHNDINKFILTFNKSYYYVKHLYMKRTDSKTCTPECTNELQHGQNSRNDKNYHRPDANIEEIISSKGGNPYSDENEISKKILEDGNKNDHDQSIPNIQNDSSVDKGMGDNDGFSNSRGRGGDEKRVGHDNWDDEYNLVNEHVLLKKNSKSIKDLIKAGIWIVPKENIKMIRERTDKKINWNYLLKKNNELLKDNVDKIYNGIYNKENIDDIFFVFDTYPYNYLNVTMSVFSLYKFASSYLNEKKEKIKKINESKKIFFNHLNGGLKLESGAGNSGGSDNGRTSNILVDNFFAVEYPLEKEVDDRNMLKIKEERRRLNHITTNRNFLRVVGSIRKHLKIVYKIFSTNEKLQSYEKNKSMYQYIPYINIKDIIIILRSFCILKYDHTSIYKYIYFYIVFFIEKFDIFYLCEAVYMCMIKKIYIRPLFLNFSKRLRRYFEGENHSAVGLKEGFKSNAVGDVYNMDSYRGISNSNCGSSVVGKGIQDESTGWAKQPNITKEDQSVLSMYEEINICQFYNNIQKALKKEKVKPAYFAPAPFNLRPFHYSVYHSANYSNLNDSLDGKGGEEKTNQNAEDDERYEGEEGEQVMNSKELKMFGPEDKRKEKLDFIGKNEYTVHVDDSAVRSNKSDVYINFYVYCLYILCKFPYTDIQILSIITNKIMNTVNELTLDELILTFYSLAELEYDHFNLQHRLYILIFKSLHLLDYRNKDMILKLVRSLHLTNNLRTYVDDDRTHEDYATGYDQYERISITQPFSRTGVSSIDGLNSVDTIDSISSDVNNINRDYQDHRKQRTIVHSVRTLMVDSLSKMILKNVKNYTPIELVDIIRYMSSFDFVNKELFNFVFSLPFFRSINEDILKHYKNNIYFNQSYYAYTKDNTLNTPIEIMLCKLYQSYLSYNMHFCNSNDLCSRLGEQHENGNRTERAEGKGVNMDTVNRGEMHIGEAHHGDEYVVQSVYKHNREISSFRFNERTLQLLKKTYMNNMKTSSYSSSSLHYEIADIIQKDFKIPCHVEYETDNGMLIDIAILYQDFKKIDKNFPYFKNIAIEINGPFHYKTKSINGGLPFLNTKTILKKRLLEHDDWQVISFPFWEIKPWFSKTRKENYILKVLPHEIKHIFNEAKIL
ncbi:RAP protein, putative [Plasmodium malariae]|uniref:RAP protein, putative n=1 Tax=Plasmodium malariae TaxID=5858 RepID=A0A1C3KL44_PLAMA|nr:RAP protein, putative [Plasmodium malariae]